MSHFYRGMIFLPCGNVYLCRLNKETDTGMETKSQNLKDKLYMWYKVRELQSKGLNKTQIGKYLGVDRSTVRRYPRTSREELFRKQNSHREYELKLGKYEEYVRGTLEEYPYISAARMHDWLKECYPDFPRVCDKTVFNFVAGYAESTVSGKNLRSGYGVITKSCLRPPTGNMPRRISGRSGYL